jgi:hypothetical protein
MKVIEQIKDQYGNLLQLWGVFESTAVTLLEEGNYKKMKRNMTLLSTHGSLHDAKCQLDRSK